MLDAFAVGFGLTLGAMSAVVLVCVACYQVAVHLPNRKGKR